MIEICYEADRKLIGSTIEYRIQIGSNGHLFKAIEHYYNYEGYAADLSTYSGYIHTFYVLDKPAFGRAVLYDSSQFCFALIERKTELS